MRWSIVPGRTNGWSASAIKAASEEESTAETPASQRCAHALLIRFVDHDPRIIEVDLLLDQLCRAAQDDNQLVYLGGTQIVQDRFQQRFLAEPEQLLGASHTRGHTGGKDNCRDS